jgi:hypothetical protein
MLSNIENGTLKMSESLGKNSVQEANLAPWTTFDMYGMRARFVKQAP